MMMYFEEKTYIHIKLNTTKRILNFQDYSNAQGEDNAAIVAERNYKEVIR